ncbi:MAG: hypothetical protein JNJ83_18015 [Verrucomicrobiaceae bacterium]|nr:hypothetical protein [Verrucomicrobiaceae bacterium]
MSKTPHNKSATPLLEAQLGGHFHFNRPATPLEEAHQGGCFIFGALHPMICAVQ